MEALDSPNFAPLVQNYKQQRKPPPTVGAHPTLALVQSSSPPHQVGTNLDNPSTAVRRSPSLCTREAFVSALVQSSKSRRHSANAEVGQIASCRLRQSSFRLRRNRHYLRSFSFLPPHPSALWAATFPSRGRLFRFTHLPPMPLHTFSFPTNSLRQLLSQLPPPFAQGRLFFLRRCRVQVRPSALCTNLLRAVEDARPYDAIFHRCRVQSPLYPHSIPKTPSVTATPCHLPHQGRLFYCWGDIENAVFA